ncbi:protein PLANT CADMIUM RESISTANCE 9-like [Perca fluviatilis]|uniref:protein PLANT CADMIUM RESISTANCE 9-like n=1 Tax=Perca fluviatilis TaxID=8168 RepID=UPI0019669E29|nr:protein PLANT CADMIUM RESISTANCE 9-like [Perca fluviatilis]
MEERPLKDWNSGLFDCFENANTFCYGFWCCPCLACTVSGKFGENSCLPLCDMAGPAIMAIFGIPMCMAPPAGLSLRAAMRNRYAIKGSLCRDIVVSCFCGWCNWCQMDRELKNRENTPTVVNVQHQNVVNVNVQQPTPMMMAPINPAPMMMAPINPAPMMMAPINPAPMMIAPAVGPEQPAQMMMPPVYQLVETKE